MTPQEELEMLDNLYVADSPYDTQLNIATRIGKLLDIVSPLPKTIETEIPGLFYEQP